jgi:hypothetical protein
MKKLILLALVIYGISCSNPEDHATGNPDSSSFNTDEQKNLNTATDVGNPSTERPDTSASPATSKENTNSSTKGTNRSYGTKQDSSKKQ